MILKYNWMNNPISCDIITTSKWEEHNNISKIGKQAVYPEVQLLGGLQCSLKRPWKTNPIRPLTDQAVF
jgi:hypothetical protein